MAPKPLQPKWLDRYKYPGQKVEIRTQEGASVALAICSSPSEAQTASGMGNFSIIDVVVEKSSAPEEVLNAKPDDAFDISKIHGPGFSNPVNDEIKLPTFLEVSAPFRVIKYDHRTLLHPCEPCLCPVTSKLLTGEKAHPGCGQWSSWPRRSQVCNLLGFCFSHRN